MTKSQLVMLLACGLFLLGCNKSVESISGSVDRAAQAIEKASDTMALAVPGERWNRLVDVALHGSPAEKEKAAHELDALFGIDISSQYEITIWYEFNPKANVHTAVTTTDVPTEDGVRQYCGVDYEPTAVNSMESPQTTVHKYIQTELAAALDAYASQVGSHTMGTGAFGEGFQNLPKFGPGAEYKPLMESTREEILHHLENAITPQSTDWMIRSPNQTLTTPYYPYEGRRWLLVLINDADIDPATSGLSPDQPIVQAVAHKVGDLKQTLSNTRVLPFNKATLMARPAVECGVLHTKVRWLTHDMTNSPVINQDLLNAFKSLHQAVDELNKQYASQQKQAGQP